MSQARALAGRRWASRRTIVATKIDKLSRTERVRNLRNSERVLEWPPCRYRQRAAKDWMHCGN